MTVAEMHIAFRQYAQQMGMQNVRAILPEQIDTLLNQAITDTVNQLIRENIGITNDRVVTDNSKIGQINAFRTLYDVVEQNMNEAGFTQPSDSALIGLFVCNSRSIEAFLGKYMFLVDMSINYITDGGETTPWYPVRIIDSAYLADTLNDYVLRNTFRSPVACITDEAIELYTDRISGRSIIVKGKTDIGLQPHYIRVDVIRYPSKVKFVEDISSNLSVNCNLPDSMHGDIVKRAVDLYRINTNSALKAAQDAEQAQQRENMRNNYRNEGYQQY